MIRSNSDTTTSTNSPTPISPFSSNYSVPSEPTSDETPDLGAFTAVLRAWNHLQPLPRIVNSTLAQQESTTSSFRTRSSVTQRSTALESDSDLKEERSTVWSHRPIASYLSLGDTTTDADTDQEYRRSDDTEGENYLPRMVKIEDMDELDSSYDNDLYDNDNDDNERRNEPDTDFNEHELRLGDDLQDLSLQDIEDHPSLGYLDEALSFIAAERERWNAQREAGATTNNNLLSGIEPRRKRRRKRTKTPRAHSTTRTPTSSSFTASASVSTITASSATQIEDVDADGDADDSSSSYDQQYSSPSSGPPKLSSTAPLFKSTPGTPSSRVRGRKQQRKTKLKHSRSTPQLRVLTRSSPDGDGDEEEDDTDHAQVSPRVAQLRLLEKKLMQLFPEDREYLRKVQYKTLSSSPAVSGNVVPGAYFDSYADGEAGAVLGGFVDTRGPSPKEVTGGDNRLIHVFVDHSNILIGLLNYLKRNPRQHPQYRDNSYNSHSSSTTSPSGTGPNFIASPYPKPPKHLSHSALALILERGRPVSRRVLVTSSPLYQPMESAERLGYEVRVFARVPDLGDGMDRERVGAVGAVNERRTALGHRKSVSSGSFSGLHHDGAGVGAGGLSSTTTTGNAVFPGNTASPRRRGRSGSVNNNNSISNPPIGGKRKGHARRVSGSTSTESEQAIGPGIGIGNGVGGAGFPQAFVRSLGSVAVPVNGASAPGVSPLSSSLPSSNLSTPSASTPNSSTISPANTVPTRVRYREQGVDELLQLKLHQALASIDGPPPKNSTIVLATGDGNVGQYNEDGFLGSVRTALKRGWKVELYAWEGGLSRAWKREFGEGSEWGSSRSSGSDGKGKGDEGPKFRVIGMEQFGSELVEIYF